MNLQPRSDLPTFDGGQAAFRPFVWVGVAMAAVLAACGGGRSKPTPPPDTASKVLLQRRSPNGGSDFYRAPIDGSSAPVAVTNNGSKTIDEVLRKGQPVNNRVVYKGRSSSIASDTNFYSLTLDASTPPRQLTTFGEDVVIDAYQTVGNSLVLLAGPVSAATRDLWVMPVDGSEPARNLTSLGALDHVLWDDADADQIDTRVFYEIVRGSSAARDYYVFDTARAVNPVQLGPTTDRLFPLKRADYREVSQGLPDRYLAYGDFLFLRAERNAGAEFQLVMANLTSGSLTAMSPTFQTSLAPTSGTALIDSGFVAGNHFCYAVRDNAVPGSNLFGVDFFVSAPQFRNLTNFAPGTANTITWKSFLPSQAKVVIASATSPDGSSVTTDLFLVDAAFGASVRLLDGSLAGPTPATTDIGRLLVVGGVAIFERNRLDGAVWSTRLDGSTPAGAELLADIVGNKGIDGFVVASTASAQLASGVIDLRIDSIESAFAHATITDGSESFSDLFRISVAGAGVEVRRLTTQRTYPTPTPLDRLTIALRVGDRVVYSRSPSGWFSTTLDGSGAEVRITGAAGPRRLDPSRLIYLDAGGNLFTAPYDKDIGAGQVRALAALNGGESIDLDAIATSNRRVVFAIASGSTRRRIASSVFTPNSPSPTDISRKGDSFDTLVTLY